MALVDELVLSREEHRAARPDSRKKLDNRISKLKVDIGSHLNKRFLKETERLRCLSTLRPLINKIKLSKIGSSGKTTTPTELVTTTVCVNEGASSVKQKKNKYTVDEVRRILSTI